MLTCVIYIRLQANSLIGYNFYSSKYIYIYIYIISYEN